jgi:hypothetical protein
MNPESEYLPPAHFSRVTSIPTSTLAKLRMRGGGPPFAKIGRAVRYPVRAGLEWMAEHLRQSTSDSPQTERRPRKKRRADGPAAAFGGLL